MILYICNIKMKCVVIIILLCISIVTYYSCFGEDIYDNSYKWPTIGISVLVRNKAHTLPYFLSCLQQLDYPKDRLYVWIYSDYNEDKSMEIIEQWASKYHRKYNGMFILTNKTTGSHFSDENSPTHWSPEHFRHVINLREKALEFARKMWCDYIFMLDADVFLTNKQTLKLLVLKNHTIVAPMILSDGLYSNFWCGMADNYYYKRTEDYTPILNREKIGCFSVPMVHSAVLISLKHQISDKFTYNPKNISDYDGPEDDIIAFALNSKKIDVPLHVCNDHLYGFVTVPLEESDNLSKDYEQMMNVKLEALSRGYALALDDIFGEFISYPEPWKFRCSEIYMINLERRKERRILMELSFRELGMDVNVFKAIDGRTLDLNDLETYSISLMPGYEDPFHKRPMKSGEVGCFLSHYNIWKEIIEKRLAITLVLEDDIHFVPYFRHKFHQLINEMKKLDWDLVYIGRKILWDSEEEYATEHITKPLYSYWTLGYLLSERGAKKLLQADPLSKMLPVDEFLPIMFDQHPNDTWKAHFPNRNLLAFSASPLLVHPTHYTGQEGYISDTEDSVVVDVNNAPEAIKSEL